VTIAILNEAGDVEYSGVFTVSADDTWQYAAAAVTLTQGRKLLRMDWRVENGEWMDVSQVVLK